MKDMHFLLMYKCDLECDHCFVCGRPEAKGAFTLEQVRNFLAEAKKSGIVDYIAIEGGELFLYYPTMIKTAKEAAEVLSNCYGTSCPDDAVEWLTPLAKAGNVEQV